MYGLSSGLISYGAGLTEEVIMRGFFMPVLDLRFGQKFGLISSSLIFSAAHIPNYIMTEDPWERAYYITSVTLTGYIFGKNAQNNYYDLRQVIAAHFWYDFALLLTSWIINPEDNLFGFSVKFDL